MSRADRAARTHTTDWGPRNNTQSFLTALGAGRPSSRYQQILGLRRPGLQVHRWHLCAMSSHGGRGVGALWGLFYKDANPTMRVLPL